jgi:hypothetical protein
MASKKKKPFTYPGTNFQVDFAGYFSQHELLFRRPAANWLYGGLIGNGDLTANVFEPGSLEWGIGKLDVWDSRFDRQKFPFISHDEFRDLVDRKQWKKLSRIDIFEGRAQQQDGFVLNEGRSALPVFCTKGPPNAKPCGWLRIKNSELDFTKKSLRFEKRLSLYNGCLTSTVRQGKRRFESDTFVDARRNVLVIRGRSEGIRTPFVIELRRHQDIFMETAPLLYEKKGQLYVDYTFPDGFRYVLAMAVRGPGYELTNNQDSLALEMSEPGDFEVYITVATSRESDDAYAAARRSLSRAVTRGHAELYEEHTAWWHEFWQQSFIDIGDKFLENLWYFQLYLLASCSRSTLPPTLFSPWHLDDFQKWHGDYHGNVNIQMVYWPIFTSNHIELGKPYFDFYRSLLPRAKTEARKIYGMRGAKFPGATSPGGEELASLWFRYQMHINAWYMEAYWWHWLYTRDRRFLKNVSYDVIREIALFFVDFVSRDEHGKYCIFPSNSPEQGEWWIKDPTIDVALVKELFEGAIETSRVLGRDERLRKKWQHILENLSDYPNDGNVYLDYDKAPCDSPLRHPALMAPVFPAGQVGADGPDDLSALARNTFENILERGERKKEGFPLDMPTWNDDMSWPWLACIAARLQQADKCSSYLYDLGLLPHLRPNGLFSLDSFTPDVHDKYVDREYASLYEDPEGFPMLEGTLNSGMGLMTAINEMILQSYDGCIRVFPALPKKKSGEARFANLRAVGAFLVSSEIRKGVVQYIAIDSQAGGRCRIVNPWAQEEVTVTDLATKKSTRLDSGGVLEFSTTRNHVYRIAPSKFRKPRSRERITSLPRQRPRIYKGPKHLTYNPKQPRVTSRLGL